MSYQWIPSVAEYLCFDDNMYHIMASNPEKIGCYRNAIKNIVKDKIVLDIGTGAEAILARICVEEGAAKVYAVEILQKTFLKAKQYLDSHGLNKKIELIWGNSLDISLPEKCDLCISDVFSSIGGLEGASVILNDARSRHLKHGAIIVPQESITMVAALEIPIEVINQPNIDTESYNYLKSIFNKVGYSFDVRLCLKSISYDNLVSDKKVFEHLSWKNNKLSNLNNTHTITLKIFKNSRIYGFITWLILKSNDNHEIDTMVNQKSWVPTFLPVFPDGIELLENDQIELIIERKICNNNLNFDYFLTCKVIGKNLSQIFYYNSTYDQKNNKQNNFYKNIFKQFEALANK